MKKLHLLGSLAAALLMASCSHKESLETNSNIGDDPILKRKASIVEVPSAPALDKKELDDYVVNELEKKRDFRWTEQDIHTLWSALQTSDPVLAIGYKPSGVADISQTIHEIDLSKGTWKVTHDALKNFIIESLQKSSGKPVVWEEILVEDDPVLPILTIRLRDKQLLTDLYNLENVRYLEPLDYWPNGVEKSSSGCSGSTTAINSADFTTITPGARLPWNYNSVGIPTAWNTAQGQGITIGVIDAGISSSQAMLGSLFTSGQSAGRSISTDFTLGSSAFTSCTHGTTMSGLAAGPRNSSNATTGVAYRSNLHFIRACNDVVLDGSSERTGVKNALVRMGNRNDVRVVSMSIGTPFYSSVLLDGVLYAHNRGKLLMAAAGTSFSWTSWWGVVYPAAFSECVAVTGVNESGSTCNTCHDGGEVDFTIPMERNANSDRNTLSLAQSGNTPTYVGGSSSATAMAAGIAALVWSARPTLSRTQVLNALIMSSQYFPSTVSNRGYGNINAAAAVTAAINM